MAHARAALAAAATAFAAVVALLSARAWQLVNVPGRPDDHAWVLQDFRDAIYYPVRALFDGVNPYDPVAYFAAYPVGQEFPLYSPLTLVAHLPFGLMPYRAAEAAYFALTLLLTVVLAAACLRLAGRAMRAETVLALAALLLLSRPGQANLLLGQSTLQVVLPLLAAFAWCRTRPRAATVALALATLKPTFGVPAALLLLARGETRVGLAGLALGGAAAGLLTLGPLLSAGGVGPFLDALARSHAFTEASRLYSPLTSWLRIDLWALAVRVVGGPTGLGAEGLLSALVLGVSGLALRRLAVGAVASGQAAAAQASLTVACLAVLIGVYHQIYDVLLLAPVGLAAALGAPRALWEAHPRARWLIAALLLVPFVNYASTNPILARLGVSGAGWQALVSVNGLAMLAAWAVAIDVARRETRAAPLALRHAALAGVVLLGAALRLAYVDRPFDHRLVNPWRQSDYLAITRAFAREDMNIVYPRIDWRGDTPGYAEMELPVVPWLGAVLYRAVGPAIELQRGLAATLSIAALLLFAALARRLLTVDGALLATLLYGLNPLLIILSTSLQPEPLLELCCLGAVALLWRWRQAPRPRRLLAAAAALAAAILAKLPAACLGLLFAAVIVRRLGWSALRAPLVWGAAAVALLPPLTWYAWAHGFWRVYGLSLGVSNESHLIGWDLLWPPRFLLGIATWETLGVLTPAGWLLAAAALRGDWARAELPLLWYAAVATFYVLAGRTTGDPWSFYYHSLSVAPAALLMGAGFAALRSGVTVPARWGVLARRQAGLGGALATLTVLALVAATVVLIQRRDHGRDELAALYACSRAFAPRVPAEAPIVVRGGSRVDELGHPVAYNASMVFAWMDRRGFNYAQEDFTLAGLEAAAVRGARYWVATPDDFVASAMAGVAAHYQLVAQCGAAPHALYALRPQSVPPQSVRTVSGA